MPFPLGAAFAILMALPLIYAGARLYALNEDSTRAFKVLRPYFHLVYVALALALGIIGLIITVYSEKGSAHRYEGKFFVVAGVLLAAMYLLIRRCIDKRVKDLCSTDPPLKLG
jgi:cytochrome bd-type quinol oxidase subunit 2